MRIDTITKTIEKVFKDNQLVGYVYKETLIMFANNKKNTLRLSIRTSIDSSYDYAKIYLYLNGNIVVGKIDDQTIIKKWDSLHKIKAEDMQTTSFNHIKEKCHSGNIIDNSDKEIDDLKESLEKYFYDDRSELIRVATAILE